VNRCSFALLAREAADALVAPTNEATKHSIAKKGSRSSRIVLRNSLTLEPYLACSVRPFTRQARVSQQPGDGNGGRSRAESLRW
jgi:hypothetical protein